MKMRGQFGFGAMTVAIFLGGCATVPPVSPLPTAEVPAARETTAVASLEDAADDPAIWRNPADPAASLIVATDKKAGLNVYGLDGVLRSGLPAGRVNNVDLRADVTIAGVPGVLVAASDRNELGVGRLALYALDTAAARLTELVRVPAEVAESYGLCLYKARSGLLYAFVVGKDGRITQLAIGVTGATPIATVVRRLALPTQSEGCVADDRTGLLYVGEERAGVWRFSAEPDGPTQGTLVAPADGKQLIADVEGVAIAAEGADGGHLIVSSQGDSAYAVYRLPEMAYVGRFRIVAGGAIGGTSSTDGIEVSTAGFGAGFEGGLFIAQDGDNAPAAQNFKLVPWAAIKSALGM